MNARLELLERIDRELIKGEYPDPFIEVPEQHNFKDIYFLRGFIVLVLGIPIVWVIRFSDFRLYNIVVIVLMVIGSAGIMGILVLAFPYRSSRRFVVRRPTPELLDPLLDYLRLVLQRDLEVERSGDSVVVSYSGRTNAGAEKQIDRDLLVENPVVYFRRIQNRINPKIRLLREKNSVEVGNNVPDEVFFHNISRYLLVWYFAFDLSLRIVYLDSAKTLFLLIMIFSLVLLAVRPRQSIIRLSLELIDDRYDLRYVLGEVRHCVESMVGDNQPVVRVRDISSWFNFSDSRAGAKVVDIEFRVQKGIVKQKLGILTAGLSKFERIPQQYPKRIMWKRNTKKMLPVYTAALLIVVILLAPSSPRIPGTVLAEGDLNGYDNTLTITVNSTGRLRFEVEFKFTSNFDQYEFSVRTDSIHRVISTNRLFTSDQVFVKRGENLTIDLWDGRQAHVRIIEPDRVSLLEDGFLYLLLLGLLVTVIAVYPRTVGTELYTPELLEKQNKSYLLRVLGTIAGFYVILLFLKFFQSPLVEYLVNWNLTSLGSILWIALILIIARYALYGNRLTSVRAQWFFFGAAMALNVVFPLLLLNGIIWGN